MNKNSVRVLFLLGLVFLAGTWNVQAQSYVKTQVAKRSMGLPYVAVRLENNQTVKMSPAAANKHRTDVEQLRALVLVNGVYYLPEEVSKKGSSLLEQKIQDQVNKSMPLIPRSEETPVQVQRITMPDRSLPYVAVYLKNGQTVYMSPAAVNQHRTDIENLVLVDSVYYLPEEVEQHFSSPIQLQVQRNVMPSMGLPYVAVRLKNGQTVYMSPAAVNQHRTDIENLVLVDGVYYLPEEVKK